MPSLQVETLSDGSVGVKGETFVIKHVLKEQGGRYNKDLFCWVFPAFRRANLLGALRGQDDVHVAVAQSAPAAAAGQGARRQRRFAPSFSKDEAEALKACEDAVVIGQTARVTVNRYKGSLGVDIRHFREDDDDDRPTPTPKGIRLKVDEWMALCTTIAETSTMPEATPGSAPSSSSSASAPEHTARVELQERGLLHEDGVNRRVDVADVKGLKLEFMPRFVDIRRYFDRDGEAYPSKQGVCLSLDDWPRLQAALPEVSAKAIAARGPATKKRSKPVRAIKPAAGWSEEADEAVTTAKGSKRRRLVKVPVDMFGDVVQTDVVPDVVPTDDIVPDISRKKLRKRLVRLLDGRELADLSMRIVRRELETDMSLPPNSLDALSGEVRGMVVDIIQAQCEGEGEGPAGVAPIIQAECESEGAAGVALL